MKLPFVIMGRKSYQASQYQAWLDGHREAVRTIQRALKSAKNVYTEPLTLVGDNQTIENCVFFGGVYSECLAIKPGPGG